MTEENVIQLLNSDGPWCVMQIGKDGIIEIANEKEIEILTININSLISLVGKLYYQYNDPDIMNMLID